MNLQNLILHTDNLRQWMMFYRSQSVVYIRFQWLWTDRRCRYSVMFVCVRCWTRWARSNRALSYVRRLYSSCVCRSRRHWSASPDSIVIVVLLVSVTVAGWTALIANALLLCRLCKASCDQVIYATNQGVQLCSQTNTCCDQSFAAATEYFSVNSKTFIILFSYSRIPYMNYTHRIRMEMFDWNAIARRVIPFRYANKRANEESMGNPLHVLDATAFWLKTLTSSITYRRSAIIMNNVLYASVGSASARCIQPIISFNSVYVDVDQHVHSHMSLYYYYFFSRVIIVDHCKGYYNCCINR